jgi:hypothetical protein
MKPAPVKSGPVVAEAEGAAVDMAAGVVAEDAGAEAVTVVVAAVEVVVAMAAGVVAGVAVANDRY